MINIDKSFKSEGLVFLPPLENRLTELLALEINKDKSYKAISQYPFKDNSNKGNASYLDLVCFNKSSSLLDKKELLWALDAKLYSPHQTSNEKKYIDKSMWGPIADRAKLKSLEIERFFILLYQFEIIKIPNSEKSVLSILESYPTLSYLGKSLAQINKNINSFDERKIELLKKECKQCFGENNSDYGCSRAIAISVGETEFLIKIHYILNESSQSLASSE